MQTEKEPSSDTLPEEAGDRVRELMGKEYRALTPEQRPMVARICLEIARKEGLAALTKPRIEGAIELVTEHLWPSSFGTLRSKSPD